MEDSPEALTGKRWFVLAASCLAAFCVGSLYAWSVFAVPKAAQLSEITGLSLSAADLAIAFSVANGVGPIPMILGGFLNDRFGPKYLVISGGLLVGAGLFLSGTAQSVAELVFSYGILFGVGLALVYSPLINNSVKFFPDRKGFAGGITTACYGLCSVVLPPAAQLLIENFGIVSAFEILGLASGALIIGSGFFCKKSPAGFVPTTMKGPLLKAAQGRDYTPLQMLKTSQFWLMLLLLLCGALAGLTVISQAASIARNQILLSASAAAGCVAFLGLINTIGRLGAGIISDKFGRIQSILGACVLSAIGLLLLSVCEADDTMIFYCALACVGFAFGALMGVFPGFTAGTFGMRHNSANHGIMFAGFSLSGAVGPSFVILLCAGGSYTNAYLAALLLTALGALVAYCLSRKESAAPAALTGSSRSSPREDIRAG